MPFASVQSDITALQNVLRSCGLFIELFLQPQNILLTSDNPLGDIKIVDFGLSRMVSSNQEIREIMGTPEYVGKTCCGLYHSILNIQYPEC